MFITIVVAVILGFGVIFAMKKVSAPVSQEQQEAGFGDGRAALPFTFTLERFEWLCGRLLQELGLDVKRSTTAGSRQLEIMAVNSAPIVGGQYVVHGELLQAGEVVEDPPGRAGLAARSRRGDDLPRSGCVDEALDPLGELGDEPVEMLEHDHLPCGEQEGEFFHSDPP